MEPERVVERVTGLMAQNPHAFAFTGPLHFQHLRTFELYQPGMSEVKRNGKSGHAVRCEPLLGEPEMRAKRKGSGLQLPVELFNSLF